jgi:putative membrane protein
MWWASNHEFGWWTIFGGIWMILFWGVIIGLVIWAVRALTGRRYRPSGSGGPLEVAERRYARGEISKEEFNDIKATLAEGNRQEA